MSDVGTFSDIYETLLLNIFCSQVDLEISRGRVLGNLSGVGDGFPNTSLVLVEHGYNLRGDGGNLHGSISVNSSLIFQSKSELILGRGAWFGGPHSIVVWTEHLISIPGITCMSVYTHSCFSQCLTFCNFMTCQAAIFLKSETLLMQLIFKIDCLLHCVEMYMFSQSWNF